jgi:hypothetical protein
MQGGDGCMLAAYHGDVVAVLAHLHSGYNIKTKNVRGMTAGWP